MRINPQAELSDPQIVWCLGEIARRISLPDCADAGLFSLINLMTVEHVATRPNVQRLLQMVKNKLANPESIPTVLLNLYQEVLGNIEELADGSDAESVAMASEQRPVYSTKVAQMTRASTSVSSTPAGSTTSHGGSFSDSDESSLVDASPKENAVNTSTYYTVSIIFVDCFNWI